MKIKLSQLRNLIREQLEADTQIDPTDQKLIDIFLSNGSQAVELATQAGMGSPELVKAMKDIVDEVRTMVDTYDPEDENLVPEQTADHVEWEKKKMAMIPGADKSDVYATSAKRAIIALGDMLPIRFGDLYKIIHNAEKEWMYPYMTKNAPHRKGAIDKAKEWAGV